MAKAKEVAKKKSVIVEKPSKSKISPVKFDTNIRVSLWTKLSVRLSEKEKVLFIKYLSVLLAAGLSLSQAVDVLRDQAKGPTKNILDTTSECIKNGQSLADGLAHYPHIFTHIFVNLIRAGEESGTLGDNLEYLAVQSQKQYELKQSIRGAMMYPMIVLVGGLGVSIFIIIFIFPNILTLFQTMHIELPITTRILLAVANFFKAYPMQVILGSLITAFLLFTSYSIKITRNIWDGFLLHVPVVGSIIKNSILANFFRLLGTLLQSGMPLADALHITNSTITNHAYHKMLAEIEDRVMQGSDLAIELAKYHFLIPGLAQRLIHVGDVTGTVKKMLMFMADFYAKEVDESSKRIATLVEPLLIISMGVLIGFVALAVITPIYKVVTSI